MLPNHVKIFWRNIRRQPIYAFINIFGLGAASLVALAIAVVTVLSQAWSAAMMNPANALRYE